LYAIVIAYLGRGRGVRWISRKLGITPPLVREIERYWREGDGG
jgi:hypothetical protein